MNNYINYQFAILLNKIKKLTEKQPIEIEMIEINRTYKENSYN